jgi:hypothetical protein
MRIAPAADPCTAGWGYPFWYRELRDYARFPYYSKTQTPQYIVAGPANFASLLDLASV